MNIDERVQISELPKDIMYADLITNIIEAHGLEDCTQIAVEMVGEKDTKRPLRWSGGWYVGNAGKGNFDIGEKVSDVTITLDCTDGTFSVRYEYRRIASTASDICLDCALISASVVGITLYAMSIL